MFARIPVVLVPAGSIPAGPASAISASSASTISTSISASIFLLRIMLGPALFAAFGACFVSPGVSLAATFAVNDPGDGPDADLGDGICATVEDRCTLRAAIDEANARPGRDRIDLRAWAGTTVPIQSELPPIRDAAEIDGGDGDAPVLDGRGSVRLLVGLASLRIENVVLKDGLARGGNGSPGGNGSYPGGAGGGAPGLGGGLYFDGAMLEIERVAFIQCVATGGAGGGGGGVVGGGGGIGGDAVTHYEGALGALGGAGGFLGAEGKGGDGVFTIGIGGPRPYRVDGGPFGGGGGGQSRLLGSAWPGWDGVMLGGRGGFGAGGAGAGPSYTYIYTHRSSPGEGGAFGGNGGAHSLDETAGGGGGGGAGLGGGVFVRRGAVTMRECRFVACSARRGMGGVVQYAENGWNGQGKGGAVFVHEGVLVSGGGNVFESNSADDAGGFEGDTHDFYGYPTLRSSVLEHLLFEAGGLPGIDANGDGVIDAADLL